MLGATGTVGAELTARLVEAGHTVKAATRSPERYAGPGRAIALDLSDPSSFAPALAGVVRLFLLAPPGHADQHARDIADAAAAALTRDDVALDRAYVLTGPRALTHAEAAAVLSEAVGRTIRYEAIDDDAFRAQLAPSGLPTAYIELLGGLFAAVRMGAAAEVSSAVAELTGHPSRPLEQYAADYRAALGG